MRLSLKVCLKNLNILFAVTSGRLVRLYNTKANS